MTDPFFCHGLPGGPQDAHIAGLQDGPNLIPAGTDNPLTHALAAFDAAGDAPRPVIGFSLGAMSALAIAAARPDRVTDLTLVSPAAPLQLGDFLPHMAGRSLFRAAKDSPAKFRAATRVLGLITRVAPDRMLTTMFADAPASDRGLLTDPAAHAILRAGLRNAYVDRPKGTRAIINAYVQDWTALLPRVTRPVTIWQGMADTWTPPMMSDALETALPGPVTRHKLTGAGHYATLAAFGATRA